MPNRESDSWLEILPMVMTRCAELWQIRLNAPFTAMPHGCVAPGEQANGAPVVLKIMAPPGTDFEREEATLRAYAGHGAVRLIASDTEARALLLERILPGRPLSAELREIPDNAALRAAAAVMTRLWSASTHTVAGRLPGAATDLEALAWYVMRSGPTGGPIPQPLLDRAQRVGGELARSQHETVLAHGDLHHGNILFSSKDGWVAIDPKGRLAERAYDVAALIRNPLADLLLRSDQSACLARRIDLLSEELDLERERISGWAFVMALVAACWSLQDGDESWEGWLQIAQQLSQLRGTP